MLASISYTRDRVFTTPSVDIGSPLKGVTVFTVPSVYGSFNNALHI